MAGLPDVAAGPLGGKKVSWWRNRGATATTGQLGLGWPAVPDRLIHKNQ